MDKTNLLAQWSYFYDGVRHKLRIPAVCALCDQYHRQILALCDACLRLLTPVSISCSICKIPLRNDSFLICGRCIRQRPAFDKIVTAYLFSQPLRTLVHEFKYQQGFYLKKTFIHLMLDAWPKHHDAIDCLSPVPLHPKRLRQRGFNQSALLALSLAKEIGKPCDISLCQKIKDTDPQATLSREQRSSNIKHAFSVKPNNHRYVVLIDDIVTTGNTAHALALLLKHQGVSQVDIWCIARTDLT